MLNKTLNFLGFIALNWCLLPFLVGFQIASYETLVRLFFKKHMPRLRESYPDLITIKSEIKTREEWQYRLVLIFVGLTSRYGIDEEGKIGGLRAFIGWILVIIGFLLYYQVKKLISVRKLAKEFRSASPSL